MAAKRAIVKAGIGAMFVVAALGACGGDDGGGDDTRSGSIAGQVRIGGPVVGATVKVAQLSTTDATGSVVQELGTTTTDETGRYQLDVANRNGLFLVEASGGRYSEPESGEPIELDATATVRTLHHLDLFESRTDAMVSPIGHLVEAMARGYLADGRAGNLEDALAAVAPHLNTHFGNVDWEFAVPADLSIPAASPTEPVRAAFVLGAWGVMAEDLALETESSRQDVNSYALMVAWAEDLRAGPFDAPTTASSPGAFDGNDRNVQGGGVQIGTCPPVTDCTETDPSCPLAVCRMPLCDLWAGTPRARFGGEMRKFIQSAKNGTGLDGADTLSIADAMANNTDELLFGTTCRSSLDQLAPSISWDPVPEDGAYVRATITVRITAVDDIDMTPVAGFTDHPDTDGDPTNAVAVASIDTTGTTVGPLTVTATAHDLANNIQMSMRTFQIDNVVPELAVDDAGWYVRDLGGGQTEWWTAAASPTVVGTVSDDSPVSVRAFVGATPVGDPATVTGTGWSLTLPAGTIQPAGTDVAFLATDAAGNTTQIVERLRIDNTPPSLAVNPSPVKTEQAESAPTYTILIGSPVEFTYNYEHNGTSFDLATTASCPTIAKRVELLVPNPNYVESEIGGDDGGRNPIRYKLTASDDGIGVDLAESEYRVLRQPGDTVVLNWTPLPAGTTMGTATDYVLPLYATLLPDLRTTEGQYDVEVRVRDFLGRATTVSRCWTHKILGPALKTSSVTAASGTMSSLGLSSTTLAPPSGSLVDDVAAKFMSDTSLGASLIEMTVQNGTVQQGYVTVNLTASGATTQQSYRVGNAILSTSAGGDCDVDESLCNPPSTAQPAYNPNPEVLVPGSQPAGSIKVRMFALNTDGTVGAEVDVCPASMGCATDSAVNVYEFAVAGRGSPNQPPKKYLIAVMTGPVLAFRPGPPTTPWTGAYTDTTISGIRLSGQTLPTSTGCIASHVQVGGPLDGHLLCDQRATIRPYRVSKHLKLSMNGDTSVTWFGSASATLPSMSLGPVPQLPATDPGGPALWDRSESAFPNNYAP